MHQFLLALAATIPATAPAAAADPKPPAWEKAVADAARKPPMTAAEAAACWASKTRPTLRDSCAATLTPGRRAPRGA